MRAVPRRRGWLVALVAGMVLLGLGMMAQHGKSDRGKPVALFTSLPIVWPEQAGVRDMISSTQQVHWARDVIEQRGKVVALDTLLGLSAYDRAIIAQPRPLAPEENVALDTWVRKGGRLLMFADPMLTGESAFPIGDRRRPQDVVLLSPILARWGLELRFDDEQVAGAREDAGDGLLVNLPGHFAAIPGGHDARCDLGEGALVARCSIGKGRAVIVADAALLEATDDPDAGKAQFDRLMDEAIGQ